MKRFFLTLAFAALALAFSLSSIGPSSAEPSCVEAPQPDGTTWRTCVGDDGRRYCESCVNGVCSRVSCDG